MATASLTGQFIANTYQNLIQKPDTTLEDYYNGVGNVVYINGDPPGTIKMFYPISGDISDYFDTTGLGVTGSGWDNWAIANGQNSTPDLRGRFIVGMSNADSSNYVYSNSEKNKSIFATVSNAGGSSVIDADNLPAHRHKYSFLAPITGSNENAWAAQHTSETGGFADVVSHPGGALISGNKLVKDPVAGNVDCFVDLGNTGDGTDNISNQDETTNLSYYPAYYTLLYVIKIS